MELKQTTLYGKKLQKMHSLLISPSTDNFSILLPVKTMKILTKKRKTLLKWLQNPVLLVDCILQSHNHSTTRAQDYSFQPGNISGCDVFRQTGCITRG